MLRALGGVFPRGNEVKSFLAALGMVLVAFASLLGCSWHFLFALGAILSDLGRSWGGLGRSSAALRLLLGDLGAVLGHLGAVLGRLGELKTWMTGSACKRWTLYSRSGGI